jgi:hypothetical protein
VHRDLTGIDWRKHRCWSEKLATAAFNVAQNLILA